MQISEMKRRFSHHAPTGDISWRYERIREAAEHFALVIDSLAPESREQSLSFTSLEQSMMWANASIARNEGMLPALDLYERRFGRAITMLWATSIIRNEGMLPAPDLAEITIGENL